MLAQEKLKQTPLAQAHKKLNAKMVPFGGWEMPVQYEGILSEHEQTRQKASVFDISHMGEFLIEGDPKDSGLDALITSRLADLPVKSCRYGAILNEKGGVIDDLITFRLEEKKWMVVVNGSTTEKDAVQFKKHLTENGKFVDISSEIGKLDVQGPMARNALKPLIKGIEKLDYYTFDNFDILGENVIVSRTGYTGELGYEIYYPWSKTEDLWNELLKNENIKPAGLGARDVLRIEMAYSLYGHELEENISPLESGLTRFIDFEKDFIGKETLLKEKESGIKRKVVCLSSKSRRSPRQDHKIFTPEKKEIGVVTSGTFSPCLNRGIGLGFVESEYATKGLPVMIGNEKNTFEAEIVGRPFYKEGSLKH